jgi:hypothetical protein
MFLSCKYLKTEMLLKPSSRHRSSKNNIFKSSKSFSGRKMMLCLGCNIFFEVASCFDYSLFSIHFRARFSATKMLMLSILNWTKTFVLTTKPINIYRRNKRLGKIQKSLLHFYRLFESFPRFGKSVRTLFNGCFDFLEKLGWNG